MSGIAIDTISIKLKTKHTTLSEHLQNKIEKSYKGAKSISLAHKYMTTHVPGLVQAFQ